MLPNGHLIETVKEERKPVNLLKYWTMLSISEEGKALLRQAIGRGNMSRAKCRFTGKIKTVFGINF